MPENPPNNKKTCIQCGKPLSWGGDFCSVKCKSVNQIKRITLICCGCGKQFQKMPHLERKTNFCSLPCYWETTRREEERFCKVCGKKFIATGAQVRKGFGIYCSRKCQHKTYPKQVKKICPKCGKVYYVCPSWGKYRKFCSKKCKNDSKQDYVSRICRKCGEVFTLPIWDLNRGRGNFCKYRCYLTYRGPSLLEEKMEKVLKIADIKFEREVKFKRFHVDFLIKKFNSVIECDGEHWHLGLKKEEKDRRKDKLLNGLGYKVLRFSGTTINKFSEDNLATLVVNNLRS